MRKSASGPTDSGSNFRLFMPVLVLLISVTPLSSLAQSHIYVHNATGTELQVRDVQVGGDSISKKAWKPGKKAVPSGETVRVLAVNRTGKFNWMDPTPRFVEPGKTTTFAVLLEHPEQNDGKTLRLKLKLLGTGKSSKMWYSLEGGETPFEWYLQPDRFDTEWLAHTDTTYKVAFEAYEDGGKTHVKYSVSLR